jgi:hypothetical protein
MTRVSARPQYDAVVGLDPRPGLEPQFAFALVKLTYEIKGTTAVPSQPEPLLFDLWSDEKLEPRFPPGSDFWLDKQYSDVVIRGSAFAPGGRPTPSMFVSAQVGRAAKRIAVFGKRLVEWIQGAPRLGRPEPFTEMPLLYQNAYGGLDNRVPIPAQLLQDYMRTVALGLQFDHPGLYPRNPVGKGYLVLPDPIDGVELPNLEDPADMLTTERLCTRKPELWYRQPLPWCFEWTVGLTFPRYLFVGVDAWYPSPDDAGLPEVRRGFIPAQLRGRLEKDRDLAAGYLQEASLGMVVTTPLAGQPITLTGMHPEEPTITFTVPPAPSIEIEVEGDRAARLPLLTNLVIFPAEKKFTAVYCAKTSGLQRVFIPGIHKNIPIAARINRDAPIRYQSPPTIHDRLLAAGAASPGRGAASGG